MQKYPRGSRGSPAKGVVWETVARVRISSSAPKNRHPLWVSIFCFKSRGAVLGLSRGRARSANNFTSYHRPLRLARRRFDAPHQYFGFCAFLLFPYFEGIHFGCLFFVSKAEGQFSGYHEGGRKLLRRSNKKTEEASSVFLYKIEISSATA